MDNRTVRAILEDLLPLYNEGLVSEETKRWIEEQLQRDKAHRELARLSRQPLPAETAAPAADYRSMMRKVHRRLAIYQLMFMAISFFMAMSTSLMGNSFGFVLWYAVLGGMTYWFYRDLRLVLLIAFVPIFLWQFGDMLVDWLRGEVGQGGALPYLGMAFAGALFGAALHAVFALVGTAIAWLVGKRKPAAIALAVALAVVIGLVYDAFNGNPLNEWLAKRELKAYLEATYPDQRFRIEDGRYNFKFSQYEFDVVEVGGTEDDGARIFSFAVRGFVPRVVLDGVRLDRLDKAMMERLGAQAAAEIEDLLRAEGIAIADVQVFLTVLQGELPEDAEWHKELPLDGGISLHITLDAADLSEADVLQAAERMQRLLNEAGYDYNGVVINANLLEGEWGKDLGPLKYAVSFKRDTVIRLEDIERFD